MRTPFKTFKYLKLNRKKCLKKLKYFKMFENIAAANNQKKTNKILTNKIMANIARAVFSLKNFLCKIHCLATKVKSKS